MISKLQRLVAGSIGCAVILGSSWAHTARADIVFFDPNGTGGATTLAVGQFDEAPGNALAVNVLSGGQLVTTPFQLLYQAKIASLRDINNNPLAIPGVTTNGELTIVAQFNEIVTSSSAGVAAFSTNTSQANSFVQIYYDPAKDANDLTGQGFTNGTLIYQGTVLPNGGGGFALTSTTPVALDQSPNGNQYPTVNTVSGAGGTQISVQTTFLNTNFFLSPTASLILAMNFNTSNVVPFSQVDPSAVMFNGTPAATGGIGTLNGVSGPSFLFQADATASFALVPEPSSIAMVSIGAVGAAIMGWRRRRRALA